MIFVYIFLLKLVIKTSPLLVNQTRLLREISKIALDSVHVYYSIKHVYSTKCMYSLRCFLWSFGTVASSAGYPIGNSINNFSFAGLPNRVLNLGPKFING